jgi:hypothetical protein
MGAIVEAGSVLGFGGYVGKQYYENGDLCRMLNPLVEKKKRKVPESTFKIVRSTRPLLLLSCRVLSCLVFVLSCLVLYISTSQHFISSHVSKQRFAGNRGQPKRNQFRQVPHAFISDCSKGQGYLEVKRM